MERDDLDVVLEIIEEAKIKHDEIGDKFKQGWNSGLNHIRQFVQIRMKVKEFNNESSSN